MSINAMWECGNNSNKLYLQVQKSYRPMEAALSCLVSAEMTEKLFGKQTLNRHQFGALFA